jgi:hypothetical protein
VVVSLILHQQPHLVPFRLKAQPASAQQMRTCQTASKCERQLQRKLNAAENGPLCPVYARIEASGACGRVTGYPQPRRLHPYSVATVHARCAPASAVRSEDRGVNM